MPAFSKVERDKLLSGIFDAGEPSGYGKKGDDPSRYGKTPPGARTHAGKFGVDAGKSESSKYGNISTGDGKQGGELEPSRGKKRGSTPAGDAVKTGKFEADPGKQAANELRSDSEGSAVIPEPTQGIKASSAFSGIRRATGDKKNSDQKDLTMSHGKQLNAVPQSGGRYRNYGEEDNQMQNLRGNFNRGPNAKSNLADSGWKN